MKRVIKTSIDRIQNKNCRAKLQNHWGGNITVEAAFVMPVVIFTIFALIYLAFFLHDRCLIIGTVDRVLHKAETGMKYEADMVTGSISYPNINDQGIFHLITDNSREEQTMIENYLMQELPKGLLLSRVTRMAVNANNFNIDIDLELTTIVKLPMFDRVFERLSQVNISETGPVHDPAETLRVAEVVLETGSEIKGVEEIKEKISKFLGKFK